MALKNKWTKTASKSFDLTVQYIEKEWGKNVAIKLVTKVEPFSQLVLRNPEIGRIEHYDKQIRGFVISRKTTVLYRIKGPNITFLKFFNTLQQPTKRSSF